MSNKDVDLFLRFLVLLGIGVLWVISKLFGLLGQEADTSKSRSGNSTADAQAELVRAAEAFGLEGITVSGDRVHGRSAKRHVQLALWSELVVEIKTRGPTQKVGFQLKHHGLDHTDRFDCGRFLGMTKDPDGLARVLAKHRKLDDAIARALGRGAKLIEVSPDKLEAMCGRTTASPELLAALIEIAHSFDRHTFDPPAGPHVKVAVTGGQRCAYCHDGLEPTAPDVIACDVCHTVLHGDCWTELGRCPVLGCSGRTGQRPHARARA